MIRDDDSSDPDSESEPDCDVETLLDTHDLAALLKVAPRAIEGWRSRGDGPRWIQLTDGGAVRYEPSAVNDWLAQRAQRTRESRRGASDE